MRSLGNYQKTCRKESQTNKTVDMAQELNKIETINSEIQKNEEQIVALSFEFDTLSESKHNISSEVIILNNFVSEVKGFGAKIRVTFKKSPITETLS